MGRGKKAVYNTIANILSQIITMVCGFILPRLILSALGSSYNGITASVSQFLSVVALLRSGVGGATRASLYKSLAHNDTSQVSATVRATEIFMRKIALIFLCITVFFALTYPYLVQTEFDYVFSSTLVLIISLSTFVQYFFGITYQILFQADQREYVISLLSILTTILNTLLAAVLIKAGVGIHGVKLGSAVAFSITPIVLNLLAKKFYKLNVKEKPDFSSINQRWDAFFHQLAFFIHSNTDIALLTVFTNTKEISVYTVYYLVGNGLKNIMNTLTVGVESAFGNIIARAETETLKTNIIHFETMLHVTSGALFGAALILITPFVEVYTTGVTDVVYTRYIFGYLVIIGEMLYILRSPYEALVNAAGHFKQTKKIAFTEAGINIAISLLMVRRVGMEGVVIGTVVAIVFRNIAYAQYTAKNIIYRNILDVIKRFSVTLVGIILTFVFVKIIPIPTMDSYLKWIMYAIPVTLLSCVITLGLNWLFFRSELIAFFHKVVGIICGMLRRTSSSDR